MGRCELSLLGPSVLTECVCAFYLSPGSQGPKAHLSFALIQLLQWAGGELAQQLHTGLGQQGGGGGGVRWRFRKNSLGSTTGHTNCSLSGAPMLPRGENGPSLLQKAGQRLSPQGQRHNLHRQKSRVQEEGWNLNRFLLNSSSAFYTPDFVTAQGAQHVYT